jgi:hypothetical protein
VRHNSPASALSPSLYILIWLIAIVDVFLFMLWLLAVFQRDVRGCCHDVLVARLRLFRRNLYRYNGAEQLHALICRQITGLWARCAVCKRRRHVLQHSAGSSEAPCKPQKENRHLTSRFFDVDIRVTVKHAQQFAYKQTL